MAIGVALVAALLVGACSREVAFPDREARVDHGGRTTTFTLDSCGLDGTTAFLVGRTESGIVLQAVVGVEDDGETGVPRSTGFEVIGDADVDGGGYGAFGEEAWDRREETGTPPGEITSARIRGARIQVEGRAVTLDPDGRPQGGTLTEVSLDARCDAEG